MVLGLTMWSRGCMYQVFAASQVCEKYLAKEKDVFGRLWI